MTSRIETTSTIISRRAENNGFIFTTNLYKFFEQEKFLHKIMITQSRK